MNFDWVCFSLGTLNGMFLSLVIVLWLAEEVKSVQDLGELDE